MLACCGTEKINIKLQCEKESVVTMHLSKTLLFPLTNARVSKNNKHLNSFE